MTAKTGKKLGLKSPMDAMLDGEKTQTKEDPKESAKVRRRITFSINDDLYDRIRDIVYWNAGHPHRLTLTDLCIQAFTTECERWEKAHNGSKRWPKRKGKLQVGRPIGG